MQALTRIPMQNANVTGNSGLFMVVHSGRVHHMPEDKCPQRECQPEIGRRQHSTHRLAQFHMDIKYRTMLETLFAGDNELRSKEAA
jgi:hypothetical protein